MNVKPGDIATIINLPRYVGRTVEVLYRAPGAKHQLPDGVWNIPPFEDEWVIHSLDGPLLVPHLRGSMSAWYASCPDRCLRPLREPDANVDETTDFEVVA